MKKTTVLISDFQFLTRAGLVHLLENQDEFELLGVLDEPEELLHRVLETHPDVVLMDYKSKDPVLMSLLKQVVASRATNVLIITNESDRAAIKTLLDLGIKGVVTKKCSRHEILSAIGSVAKNNRFFCNKVLDLLVEEPATEDPKRCEPTDLSAREFEVIQLITKGMKTSDIALKLHLSVHTINSHRKNILKKLNLKSPAELIVYAMESGLAKA